MAKSHSDRSGGIYSLTLLDLAYAERTFLGLILTRNDSFGLLSSPP